MTRNLRLKFGEIDLIMDDVGTIVFVEVRYRRTAAYGSPFETIDHRKRKRILRAAQYYLQQEKLRARSPCRFDAVSLLGDPGSPEIEWVKGAFTA